jgi:hypothetical protein
MATVGRTYLMSLLVWCALLVIAVANGALREFVLAPRLGAVALPISGVTAMTAFAVAIAAFIRAVRPSVAVAARIGALWLVMTLCVETLMTVAAGRPAADVAAALAPAALAKGDLLLGLLLVTTLAPPAFAWLQTAKS